MEDRFFTEACRHLDAAAANNDRLIDAIRAAMLLSAYTYTNNRHLEVSCPNLLRFQALADARFHTRGGLWPVLPSGLSCLQVYIESPLSLSGLLPPGILCCVIDHTCYPRQKIPLSWPSVYTRCE